MPPFQDFLESIIFFSYCILSTIVFQLYVKNARNVRSLQVTSVVVLTAMFLMFCALTHLSHIWGGMGHDVLTIICTVVSSATAVVTLKLRSSFDEMLTNRFRAVKLMEDDTILDLVNGYNLNINVLNKTIVSGTVNGTKILRPKHLPFDGEITTGDVVDVTGLKFRIIHKIQSNIGLDKDIEDSDNDVAFLLLGVDVTEEYNSQQLVKETSEKLLALCLSTAHEIRTPLTSVLVSTKLLRRETASYLVDDMYAHLELLSLVASNMIEVGRIMGGHKLIPSFSKINLRDMFSRMKLLSQYIHDDNVECSCEVDDTVPEIFSSDEKWVWQIFLGFMATAFKYTSSGYVKAHCSASTSFVTIRVTDSGMGFTEEDRDRLFELYVDPKTHSESNNGAGLYTTKKKLDCLGGFCSITPNTDTTGSIFEATFPVTTDDDFEEERSVRLFSRNSVKTILVVDDTSSILLVMKRALRGHQVDVAYNGEVALKLMLEKEYDFVFMDLSMPLMGGLEATTKFRAQEGLLEREIKQVIIMMSATEIDRPDIFDMKLSKPIDQTVLQTLII